MQSILPIAALVLIATPLTAFADPATPLPEGMALAVEVRGGAVAYEASASKRARSASLIRQAERLCRMYQGEARDVCVGEARMKFTP